MVKKIFLILLCVSSVVTAVFCDEPFKKIDSLIEQKKYDQARRQLESPDLSEVGVTLRRAFILFQEKSENFNWKTATKEDKEELKAVFQKAFDMVESAFSVKNALEDDEVHMLYYGRAFAKAMIISAEPNLGSLKEVKYIMRDLEQALELKPDYEDAAIFTAGMYQGLPGKPLSQGDKQKAISFMRYTLKILENADNGISEKKQRALEAYAKLGLSEMLAARNWKESKRLREQEKGREKLSEASGLFEKLGYYEAEITLPEMSDREEARRLYASTNDYFTDRAVLSELTSQQIEDLNERLEKLEKRID